MPIATFPSARSLRRSALGWWLLLLLLIPPFSGTSLGTNPGPTGTRPQKLLQTFQANRLELRQKFVDDLATLAKTCDDKGLSQAAAEVRKVAADAPQTEFRADDLSRKVQPDLPANLSADERFWQAQLRFERTKFAKDLYLLSRRVLHGGFPSFAYDIVREVAHHDPDHISARRLLGFVRYGDEWVTPVAAAMYRKRYVWHEDFGWLPSTHVERYERGERFFKGRWIDAAKEAELRRDFRDAWEIRTDHYLVRTNHSLERGVELAKTLEEFYRFFFQTFAAFFNTPEQMQKLFEGAQNRLGNTSLPEPYQVHYYRTRDEYVDRLKEKIPQIGITNGLYYTGDRTAYFYHDEAAGDNATLYHEATHQLFYESDPRERSIAENGDFWVVEGIACYMESLRRDDGRYSLGNPGYIRFEAGRYRFLVDRYYIPLAQFRRMGMAPFQTDPNIARNYSQAANLCHFFMHYGGGEYRDALIEHLAQLYRAAPRAGSVKSLAELTGVGFEELDRQYGEFVIELNGATQPPEGSAKP